MQQFKARVSKFLRDEEGLTTVEYAIAGGMVGAGAIAAFNLLGIQVGRIVTEIKDALAGIVITPTGGAGGTPE